MRFSNYKSVTIFASDCVGSKITKGDYEIPSIEIILSSFITRNMIEEDIRLGQEKPYQGVALIKTYDGYLNEVSFTITKDTVYDEIHYNFEIRSKVVERFSINFDTMRRFIRSLYSNI